MVRRDKWSISFLLTLAVLMIKALTSTMMKLYNLNVFCSPCWLS
jgi:hypothetical protein